jgi:hypothetical protein
MWVEVISQFFLHEDEVVKCPQQILAFELVPFNYPYIYLLSLSNKSSSKSLIEGSPLNLVKYPLNIKNHIQLAK